MPIPGSLPLPVLVTIFVVALVVYRLRDRV